MGKFVRKAINWGKANEPTLWGVIGICSWAGAAIASAMAAIEINKEIEAEMAKRNGEKLPKKETALIVAKKAAVPMLLAVTGTACIAKGNNMNLKRIAGISSLLTVAENKAESIAESSIETIGKKKTEEIQAKAAQKEIEKEAVNELDIQKTGHGMYLFRFDYTGQYFRSTLDDVQKGLNAFNKRWSGRRGEEAMSLADLTDEWGLDRSECSSLLGWHRDDLGDDGVTIDKSTGIGMDDEPCYVIGFSCPRPRVNWWTPASIHRMQ